MEKSGIERIIKLGEGKEIEYKKPSPRTISNTSKRW